MPDEQTKQTQLTSLVGYVWLLPLLLAATELIAHTTTRARTPTRANYRAVADTLRAELRPTDQVLAAPDWSSPLLREQLGDVLGVTRAGAVDLEPFSRLFVVSQRGHVAPLAPRRPPDATRRIGNLTVARYDLGPSTELYDFRAHWREAEVEVVTDGQTLPCRLVPGPIRGGGLGQGVVQPNERFVCDPTRPWIWFAPTVTEDLDLTLRACLFQHPPGPEPFRVSFPNVPLGERLVLDADIYYENERSEMHGLVPFELRVKIDDRDVGTLRHVDGDGRRRMVLLTGRPGEPPRTGKVTIETTTADPHLRTVCWSGGTRGPAREGVEP